jgi:hypothetical protein
VLASFCGFSLLISSGFWKPFHVTKSSFKFCDGISGFVKSFTLTEFGLKLLTTFAKIRQITKYFHRSTKEILSTLMTN